MPEKVEAFRCQFRCGVRPSTNIKTIEKHEKNCFSNPSVRACRICKYLIKEFEEVCTGMAFGEPTYSYQQFCFCQKEIEIENGRKLRRNCELFKPKGQGE